MPKSLGLFFNCGFSQLSLTLHSPCPSPLSLESWGNNLKIRKILSKTSQTDAIPLLKQSSNGWPLHTSLGDIWRMCTSTLTHYYVSSCSLRQSSNMLVTFTCTRSNVLDLCTCSWICYKCSSIQILLGNGGTKEERTERDYWKVGDISGSGKDITQGNLPHICKEDTSIDS